jgi:hypothetical protein
VGVAGDELDGVGEALDGDGGGGAGAGLGAEAVAELAVLVVAPAQDLSRRGGRRCGRGRRRARRCSERPGTVTARGWSVRDPSPIWPSLLFPQQATAPDLRRAQVWLPRLLSEIIGSTGGAGWRRAGAGLGPGRWRAGGGLRAGAVGAAGAGSCRRRRTAARGRGGGGGASARGYSIGASVVGALSDWQGWGGGAGQIATDRRASAASDGRQGRVTLMAWALHKGTRHEAHTRRTMKWWSSAVTAGCRAGTAMSPRSSGCRCATTSSGCRRGCATASARSAWSW